MFVDTLGPGIYLEGDEMIPLLLGAIAGACLFYWMLSSSFRMIGFQVWLILGGCSGAFAVAALSPFFGYEGSHGLQTETYALNQFYSVDGPFVIVQGDGTYLVDIDPMPGIQRLPVTTNIFFHAALQEEQREDGIAIVTTSKCESLITFTTICWRKEVNVIYAVPQNSVLDLVLIP